MQRTNHISAFTLPALLILPALLTSCSQEEAGLRSGSDVVSFVASLPGVATRSTYDLDQQLLDAGFIVSGICPEDDADTAGRLAVHCEDVEVVREVDGVFRSKDCRWPDNAGSKTGRLRFFAFHPSRGEMKGRAGVGDECFVYSNLSTKDASGVNYDYRLTKFRVIPDISKQVDFVTAIGEGNKTAHLYTDIKVGFEHQLSGVQIGVWGGSTLYDVEVAGVRIGGMVVEADFSLSHVVEKPGANENTIGKWMIPDSPKRGYVDYVFTEGDTIVNINAKEHNTKDLVGSIMGHGGKAMVIPQKQGTWDYKNDRENRAGMYFSVLIRMREREGDRHIVFPSTEPESQDYIVYLSVNKESGRVMKRLDKRGYAYGTSAKYNIPPTEELRCYGWAAVPVNVDWKPGYTYSYVLDYSKGVGVHDPADPNPVGTIVEWEGVGIGLATTTQWANGEIITIDGWGANSNKTGPDGTIWWK